MLRKLERKSWSSLRLGAVSQVGAKAIVKELTIPNEALTLSKIILRRRSLRSFELGRRIDSSLLRWIFTHCRWAPSAHNSQPWYVVASKPKRLNTTLYRGNEWALKASQILAIIASADDDVRVNGIDYYALDCGIFVGMLLLLCESLGIRAHPMAGFNESTARARLGLSEGYRIVLLIAIGYPGDISSLDKESQSKDLGPRVRKEVDDFMLWENWRKPRSRRAPPGWVVEFECETGVSLY